MSSIARCQFASVACAVLLIATVSPADAAVIMFGSRAAFNAAVDTDPTLTKTVQTFDGLATNTVIPNGTSVAGVTYTSSTGDSIITNDYAYVSPAHTLGRTAIEYFLASDTLTLAFASPISAFGISINTFDIAAGGYTLTTNFGDIVPSGFDPFPTYSTGEFAGFATNVPITSLVIAAPGGFSYTLDDLTFATSSATPVVPEPSSLALAAIGAVAGLGAFRRRFKPAVISTTP